MVNGTPSEKLRKISNTFDDLLAPRCLRYLADPLNYKDASVPKSTMLREYLVGTIQQYESLRTQGNREVSERDTRLEEDARKMLSRVRE